MKADQRLNIATLVIILVLFRVFFGRWRGAFLMIVSLAMCGLIVNGLMSLFGSPIDLLSNLLFIVVAAASVEDFLFVSFLRQQAQKYTPAIFSRMIVPSFLTSLTTIIGFGALAFSDLPPIRRFGVWSAVGAGLEWAVIFLVFPCLMRYVPYLRDWAVPTRGFGASILGRVAQLRLPRIATACALLLAGASLYGMTTLEVDDGPKQTFPKDHPHTAALDYLGTSRGWESTFFVVFPPEATRDTVRSVVDGLAQSVNVTSVVDGYTHVERFTAGLPETSRQLVAGDFKSTELYDSYFSRTGEVRAMVFVEKSTLGAMRPLRERVAQLCAGKGCYAAGDLISYGELCDRIVKTFIEAIGISLGLIALMLVAVSWGIGWRRTTALVVSAMWGPLVSLGSYAWLGFDLNFVTTVFISVLVGLAGDNALQYLWANPRQGIAAGADELGVSSVQTAAIMGCCMLLFCFSSFNYPRVLGGAFAAAFALLLIGDLFLLRGLLASTAEPAADDEVATPQKLVHG